MERAVALPRFKKVPQTTVVCPGLINKRDSAREGVVETHRTLLSSMQLHCRALMSTTQIALHARIKTIAQERDVSIALIYQTAVERYLDELEDAVKTPRDVPARWDVPPDEKESVFLGQSAGG